MTRYFRNPKLADTFYGQPVGAHPQEPIVEFEIIGSTRDLITAARVTTDRHRLRTVHIFSRHTGRSTDGWGHVASFKQGWFVNLRANKKAVGWVWFLTLTAICVLIVTWPIDDFSL